MEGVPSDCYWHGNSGLPNGVRWHTTHARFCGLGYLSANSNQQTGVHVSALESGAPRNLPSSGFPSDIFRVYTKYAFEYKLRKGSKHE